MNIETLAPHLLPLAMGLAGAALYHLIGPMLRGVWLVLRVLAYTLWMSVGFVGFLFGMHDESPQGWGCRLFPPKPEAPEPSQPFDRIRALEERMGKVEEEQAPRTPYASGKPCPKPTKDLRPGDEVSIRCTIHGVYETGQLYLNVPSALVMPDELDKIRTDNK